MSDAIAFPPLIALPTANRDEDFVMDRLATWLADVSAEAAHQPPSTSVELPAAEDASP